MFIFRWSIALRFPFYNNKLVRLYLDSVPKKRHIIACASQYIPVRVNGHGDSRPEILIPSWSAFTGNVNDSFVMQFITAPMTLLGPRSDGQKREGRPLSLKEGRKKKPFWDQAQKTQGDAECGGCQALGIHDWVFFLLIGSGSCLKRRSRG